MAQKKQRGAVSERLAMAIGHPIRIEALRILNERVASPSELAKELDMGVSQVSYHIKELRRQNCIELVRTEPRRGAVEHYYRATEPELVSDRELAQLSEAKRQEVSIGVLQTVIAATAGSLQAGTFDKRSDRHLSWVPMQLDETGWKELTKALAKAVKEVEGIKAASAKRLGDGDAPGIASMVAMMGFETASGAAPEAS